MTLIADPHSASRTELPRPIPPGPSSRWMMDGSEGETRDRNGNSSRTTRTGSPVSRWNRYRIASFQSLNGRLMGSLVYRTSASENRRSDSASVASVAAKYRPLVTSASACNR